MAFELETPSNVENAAQPAWLGRAVSDAYTVPAAKELTDAASSVGEFAKDHWKELTGVGLTVIAGTAFVVGRKYGLGPLAGLLKGGETAAAAEKGVLAEGALARLKNVDDFVFDMDRTLVDHQGAMAVLERTMTDGLTRSSGLSRQFISESLTETAKRLDSPYFWNRLDEIRPLQAHFPGVNLNQRFADVAVASKQAYYDALKAKPETVELLDLLRSQGKGVHVFTAGTPTRALEKLTGAGLVNKVDRIYTSGVNAFEDSGAAGLLTKKDGAGRLFDLSKTAKKDGSGYEIIARDLKKDGSRMAMTGDHPIEDVANAKAHNYFTALATWYRREKAVIAPDLELTSPSQFTTLLKTKVFGS